MDKECATVDEVREMVLRRLGLDSATDEIQWAVTKAEDIIKGYCCLPAVPIEGKILWADLSYDLAQETAGIGGLAGSTVVAASMGDVSYTFGSGDHSSMTADFLAENYRHRLDKMRRGLFRT
ncbi:MAG: hypothetical protein U0M15_06070 [Bacillota bacterium]|nr:hypothetical protein [Bacillota bacterium]